MKHRYFAFSSLTYAYKGQDALYSTGIRSKIIRLSGAETEKGGRYGVEVSEKDGYDAKAALIKYGVPFTEPR
jgi:hypothetical protein